MNDGKSPPPAQPRARIVDPLEREFDPQDFTAGGGKGNVRFKAELIAKACKSNMAIYEELAALQRKLHDSDQLLELDVSKLIREGVLELNKSYITSLGVLSVVTHPSRQGLQVHLLVLSDNCDHFDINSNAKVPTTDKPVDKSPKYGHNDDGIPF